jgi:hypothetical protein
LAEVWLAEVFQLVSPGCARIPIVARSEISSTPEV